MKKIAVLLIAFSFMLACSKKTVSNKTENTEKTSSDKVSNEVYLAGKKVYMEKCGKCHTLFSPQKGNMDYWNKWVEKMAPKAKLSADEKSNVLDYLSLNAHQ